jgi:hypothetical protein
VTWDYIQPCNSARIVQRTCRLWHPPARLARHAGQRVLKLSRTWPWTETFLTCRQRLLALPEPTRPAIPSLQPLLRSRPGAVGAGAAPGTPGPHRHPPEAR